MSDAELAAAPVSASVILLLLFSCKQFILRSITRIREADLFIFILEIPHKGLTGTEHPDLRQSTGSETGVLLRLRLRCRRDRERERERRRRDRERLRRLTNIKN